MLQKLEKKVFETVDDAVMTAGATRFAEHYSLLQQRAGQVVPRRNSFRPQEAKAFLSRLSILEVVAPDEILVRLSGTANVNRRHVDLTGTNLLDVVPQDRRMETGDFYLKQIQTPCGGYIRSTEIYRNFSWPIEVISFPFADETDRSKFVFSLVIELSPPNVPPDENNQAGFGKLVCRNFVDIGGGCG